MEKSSSKLMVLVLALLIITSYLQVDTEARYIRRPQFPCNTVHDCEKLLPDCEGHLSLSCEEHSCKCKIHWLPAATSSAKVHDLQVEMEARYNITYVGPRRRVPCYAPPDCKKYNCCMRRPPAATSSAKVHGEAPKDTIEN